MSGAKRRRGINMPVLNGARSTEGVGSVGIDRGVDIARTLNFVWRQWKLIASVFACILLIGAAYLSIQTRLYTATVQILLDPRKERAVGSDPILSEFRLDIGAIQSQIAIIQSTALLRRVVEK